jgi:hypothetical protein
MADKLLMVCKTKEWLRRVRFELTTSASPIAVTTIYRSSRKQLNARELVSARHIDAAS